MSTHTTDELYLFDKGEANIGLKSQNSESTLDTKPEKIPENQVENYFQSWKKMVINEEIMGDFDIVEMKESIDDKDIKNKSSIFGNVNSSSVFTSSRSPKKDNIDKKIENNKNEKNKNEKNEKKGKKENKEKSEENETLGLIKLICYLGKTHVLCTVIIEQILLLVHQIISTSLLCKLTIKETIVPQIIEKLLVEKTFAVQKKHKLSLEMHKNNNIGNNSTNNNKSNNKKEYDKNPSEETARDEFNLDLYIIALCQICLDMFRI